MRLYVGNLPFKATEADLESFFSQAGVSVNQISMMRDKFSGEARGFGFVDVPDSDGGDGGAHLQRKRIPGTGAGD